MHRMIGQFGIMHAIPIVDNDRTFSFGIYIEQYRHLVLAIVYNIAMSLS